MISIIIPIFNAEKTLKQALESIQQQSYKDIEVILINDGSMDQSERICAELVNQDERFKYFYQENQGVSEARNQGILKSAGEFITFIDADDLIAPNYLEILKSYSDNNDIVICDISVIKEGKEIKRFTLPNIGLSSREALNELLIRKNLNSGPCGKLIKKECIGNIRYKDYITYEDIIFNMEVFREAKKIYATNETEYKYVQNPKGAMSKMIKIPSQDIIRATDQIMKFIVDYKELDEECTYTTLSHLFQYVQIIVRNKYNEEGKIFLRETAKLYKKYLEEIINCSTFPIKEKIIFVMYAFGILYCDNKLIFV